MNENRVAIVLSSGQRWGSGASGMILLLFPVGVYVDRRAGILGEGAAEFDGFEWTLLAFVAIGGILLLSAILGRWLVWKDMSVLDESAPASKGAITSVAVGKSTAPEQGAPGASVPPFDGSYTRVDIGQADKRFLETAANYFREELRQRSNFYEALQEVHRTAFGRPSWVFLVKQDDGTSAWIRVPHAGRGGSGAAPIHAVSSG